MRREGIGEEGDERASTGFGVKRLGILSGEADSTPILQRIAFQALAHTTAGDQFDQPRMMLTSEHVFRLTRINK